MLSVPEPLPNDPEAVVTALETAEIFGKQGDLKEAVRWVRRAAEIAGDEGSDERALTLARAVADLNISASQAPQPPPPLPRAAAATAASDDPDADAETRVVDSAKVLEQYEKQQQGSNGAAAAAAAAAAVVAAPAPIAAAHAAALDVSAHAVEEPPPPPPPAPSPNAVETAPAPETYPDEMTPASRRGIGSMAELLARKEAEVSSARAAAEAAMPADTSWDDPGPPPPPQPSTAPQPSTPPVERRTARPAGERIPTPLIPSAPYTERPPVNAPLHQAVRASVVATAEPGVFVLRVLTADQPPAPTAHEVLVVVTNPSSSPFK